MIVVPINIVGSSSGSPPNFGLGRRAMAAGHRNLLSWERSPSAMGTTAHRQTAMESGLKAYMASEDRFHVMVSWGARLGVHRNLWWVQRLRRDRLPLRQPLHRRAHQVQRRALGQHPSQRQHQVQSTRSGRRQCWTPLSRWGQWR